jgi:hypothetical protein
MLRAALVISCLAMPAAAFAQAAASQPSGSPSSSPYSTSFAPDSRLFEMRTYHANPGKLDVLNTRFRDHTISLFKRHGMDVIAFWMPVQAPADGSGGTLIYILAYPSMEAREAAWKAFNADPEWVSVREASEKDGKLVSKVDQVFMKATDYSGIK